jgi:nucleotide-binding universal stress UspA family protein
MKPLVVPTNFSASSVNAAKYAAELAVAMHTDLYLLHVLVLPVSTSEIPLPAEIFDEMKQSGQEELGNLKTELDKQTKSRINILTFLEIGTVEHQLEEFCKRKAPSAVVMGIKKNPKEQLIFGSNVFYSVKHLHYPLFIIPDNKVFHPINKVVFACDLSDLTESNEIIPLEFLKQLELIFHPILNVLCINTKESEQMKANKEFVALNNVLHDFFPIYYFNLAKTVEEGINKFLEGNNADLLLLLPKYHGFFEFHKSHTKKISLNTNLPILAIHE